MSTSNPRPRRPRELRQIRLEPCHATGCADVVPPGRLFCERCDRLLQSDVRALLGRLYRPGQPLSKACAKILQQAIAEIFAARIDGHRAPRPQSFEFDDPPAATDHITPDDDGSSAQLTPASDCPCDRPGNGPQADAGGIQWGVFEDDTPPPAAAAHKGTDHHDR